MNTLHRASALLALVCLLFLLSACGAAAPPSELGSDDPAVPEPQEETLGTLLGEDYRTYIIDTITMQMENRMDKTPDVVFYPIADNAPLTDYVVIDENTPFSQDEEGNITLTFEAGAVTDTENGAQSFRIPLP